MTDRVLTEDELQHMISSRGRVSLDMAKLIVSHRLQAARIKELEKELAETQVEVNNLEHDLQYPR